MLTLKIGLQAWKQYVLTTRGIGNWKPDPPTFALKFVPTQENHASSTVLKVCLTYDEDETDSEVV